MNTPSTIREQAAQIDAGAEALRQRLQAGKTLRPWPQIPNSSKKKWREYATVVLAAAALPLPEQTKEEEGWRTMESAPKDGTWVLLWWPHWHHAPITGYFARGIGLWVADRALGVDGVNPTRWMPLPVPPASSIPSKKEDGNG